MLSSPRLLAAIREFTDTIVSPYDLQGLLYQLTGYAAALTGAQGAGIMLADRASGLLGFAAASDDRVAGLEVLQDHLEAGPCHEVFVGNALGAVADLQGDGRWPAFERRASQLGVRAVASVPMHTWGQTIGVIDIYRDRPGPWRPDDLEAARIITALGAGYVLHVSQLQAQFEVVDHLRGALESRDVIGQAKGILMARHGIDATTALARLRSMSQDAGVELHVFADRLVGQEAMVTP